MTQVLTALAPVLFAGGRLTPREMTGYVGACRRDFKDQGVYKGGTVKVSVVPALTAHDSANAMTFTAGDDRTPTTIDFTLNQAKEVNWNLSAEDERQLMISQTAQDVLQQTINQGLRTLVNSMESYLATTARRAASRAYGIAGTAPFGTPGISDLAAVLKILKDNGAAEVDLQAVINTAAGLNLRSLSNLFKVNEAGDGTLLRAGSIGDLFGFNIRESAAPAAVTKGTGASYTSDTAGYAVGATSITLITGTGTVLAGDVVTFAGDTNKYVVKTGVAAPGTIVLQEPGLLVALAASAVAMTVGNTYTANSVFQRNALVLVARPALQPEGPIAEQMIITDKLTGLTFLLLRVVGNGMTSWYMKVVYDAFAPNPYAIATLLG